MEYKTTQKITKERIKEALRIKKEKGLTAETIVEEAKNKKSCLHDLFVWDDTKAAHQWRLQQARVFINEIKILVDSKEYYAFENISINVNEDSQETMREYKSKTEIMNNEEWRKQIANSAYAQLIYWKNKYEQYNFAEFESVMKAIDSVKFKTQVVA